MKLPARKKKRKKKHQWNDSGLCMKGYFYKGKMPVLSIIVPKDKRRDRTEPTMAIHFKRFHAKFFKKTKCSFGVSEYKSIISDFV